MRSMTWVVIAILFGVAACGNDSGNEPADVPESSATIAVSTISTDAEAEAYRVIERAIDAYNAGDVETWWEMRVPGGYWESQDMYEEDRAHALEVDAIDHEIGSRLRIADCVSSGVGEWPGVADDHVPTPVGYRFECDIVATNPLHDLAGIQRSEVLVWVIADGEVVAVRAEETHSGAWNDFLDIYVEWLILNHPTEIADFTDDWQRGQTSIEGFAIAMMHAEEFFNQSPDWPRRSEPMLSKSIDGVDVFNANSLEVALVGWAFERFDAGGIPRPQVNAVIFPPTEACDRGYSGLATHTTAGSSIQVCISLDETDPESTVPRIATRTILHELAHVWNTKNLIGSNRDGFLELRGLSSWSGEDWQSSGSEQAAEILTWGLEDKPTLPRIPNAGCSVLAEAYRNITGHPPSITPEACESAIPQYNL